MTDSAAQLEETLTRVPLLASLDRRTIRRLASQASRRTFAPGQAIVREGDAGVALYVILRGRVRVERGPQDPPQAVGELGPGDFFGELALIEEHARTATVIAIEETECVLFVAWEFRALLDEHPRMALPIMKALIARLHRAEHASMSPPREP